MRRSIAAAGSFVFFLVAPGFVAGVVPWWFTRWQIRAGWLPLQVVGGVLLVAGAAVLIHSFAKFALEGRGTPAPIAPTERLVVGGLYRHVRNPMYVALLAAIVGQALLFGHPGLFLYAAGVFVTVAAFVRWYEEPTLQRQFGEEYETYRRAVRAWWPRLRPWRPGEQDQSRMMP